MLAEQRVERRAERDQLGALLATDAAGRYRLKRKLKRGRYYALAPATVESAAGACLAARSPAVRVR